MSDNNNSDSSKWAEVKSELNVGEPTKELLEWARKNIKEDPDTKCQKICDLRDLIFVTHADDVYPKDRTLDIEFDARGECTPHRTDDAFLLRFLRARNFSLEGAYHLCVNYYEYKENNPEFYEGVRMSVLKKGNYDVINVPPYRDQNGRRLLIYRLGNWSPEIATVADVFKATMILLELAILEQRQQIMGGVVIFDLANVTMQHLWYLNPSIAYKVVQIMVTSFYIKVHELHVLNQPWMFDTIYNVFKPFLNDRMKARIFFHGSNMESLHKHINPKHLPDKYGGVHPLYDYNEWLEWFKTSETIKWEMESLGYIFDL